MTPNWIEKICQSYFQGGPNMTPRWFQREAKMIPKLPWADPNNGDIEYASACRSNAIQGGVVVLLLRGDLRPRKGAPAAAGGRGGWGLGGQWKGRGLLWILGWGPGNTKILNDMFKKHKDFQGFSKILFKYNSKHIFDNIIQRIFSENIFKNVFFSKKQHMFSKTFCKHIFRK